MPAFTCTWSINKFARPAKSTNGEVPRVEADNETHVVEIIRERIAGMEKVRKEDVHVTGVRRAR